MMQISSGVFVSMLAASSIERVDGSWWLKLIDGRSFMISEDDTIRIRAALKKMTDF